MFDFARILIVGDNDMNMGDTFENSLSIQHFKESQQNFDSNKLLDVADFENNPDYDDPVYQF